ncbi:MAG: C1 family peptidase [Phycisphaerae bacterium]|jgi:C1A family cysteine protease
MSKPYRIARLGWLPDPLDHRDLRVQSATVKTALERTAKFAAKGAIKARATTKLPPSVDLSSECTRIENQGEIGSCTAHSVVGLLEYLWKQTYGKAVDASRLFVYKATRNLLGWTGDTGAFVRSTIKAVRLFGACPEDYWPYDEPAFDNEPPAFCYAFAQNFKTIIYYRLEEKVDALRASLAQGVPFAFGFTCFESLFNPDVEETGVIPFPGPNEAVIGGHAIMAVGYEQAKKRFIIRNSWGRGWGRRGYGYLPYAYVEQGLADDCWCIVKSQYEGLE